MTEGGQAKPGEPEKLAKAHDRTGFESGAAELDEWLKKYSWQNQRANNATTYVSTFDGRVVGYYAITVAGYARGTAPEAVAKKAPETVPCFLLARLAVDLEWQGRGLGWGLLRDAMRRVLLLSRSVAAPALLVHARDDTARAFSLHHAEFLESPVDPLHLFLPMKAIASFLSADHDFA
ncbi:GNAT family N-acetyltransferase [Mycobacterium heidelbergense]|uniref:GNAT family N-acetyltransferase n=1 Tax=Mycobacterium heidelbergense TaxID=53376 RepID=A0A1X0DBT5_MYCHE|nr:GNAT family N-acetyltransferase [Mycobacterium heidelbergense]MCV7052662.1 GNAT family N-acetyltransferase [Mycobacterium heidelbergense]ORA69864.1 GNAT family N-acetyltransferase [Mycobacterium heidelbergense]BBZ50048.1 N-acetyltransferase GCN5 [Mycobacterium heidelbergense]